MANEDRRDVVAMSFQRRPNERRTAVMRTKVKYPNGIIYFLLYILIYPVLKLLFLLKVDRENYKPPKGPFIVLSNHLSFMDFLLVMLTIYPRRLNVVTAQKFFLYWPLNKLLPLMGCIPKNLFDTDIRTIAGIKIVLKRGGRVLLFPEGRCSVDGNYMGIQKITGGLIKNVAVPVITCNIEGAYNCMPFWRKGTRFGRVRVTLSNLFTAEDTKTLSADEISLAIDRSLSGMNIPKAAGIFRVFRPKRLAEGLENIIYYCPECGREFTLETTGNAICCMACGGTAEMDRYGNLTSTKGNIPKNVHDWYKMQAIYETRILKENNELAPAASGGVSKKSFDFAFPARDTEASREIVESVKTQVIVRMPLTPGRGIEPCGNGTLWLEPKGWHYDGLISGEEVNLFFPIETVPAIPFDPNDNFQIYSNRKFYTFTPKNKRACSKYATIGECAHWLFTSSRMTPGYDSGFCESIQSIQ